MSIIKHISVYDGNRWNSFPIGAEATNISYNDNGTIKSLNTVINDLNNSVSGYDSELTRLEEKIDSKVSGTFVTIPQAGSASGAQSAYAETRPDLETPQYWRMNINSKDTSGNNVRRLLYATDNGIGLWDGVNDQQVWSLSSTLNTSIDTINNNLNNTIKNVTKNGNNFVFTRTNGSTFSLADADTNTTYSANNGLKMNGTTVQHNTTNPGTTAVGPTGNVSPAFGKSFTVPYFNTDTYGHVNSKASRTITLPSNTATTSVAGLMSASDKKKLNNAVKVAFLNKEWKTSAYTCSAYDYRNILVPMSKPDSTYSALAIRGVRLETSNGSHNEKLHIYGFNLDDANINVAVYNATSSAINFCITLDIIFYKFNNFS